MIKDRNQPSQPNPSLPDMNRAMGQAIEFAQASTRSGELAVGDLVGHREESTIVKIIEIRGNDAVIRISPDPNSAVRIRPLSELFLVKRLDAGMEEAFKRHFENQ